MFEVRKVEALAGYRFICFFVLLFFGFMTIVASGGGGSSDAENPALREDGVAVNPEAPENVTSISSKPDDGSVILTWCPSSDADDDLVEYRIYLSENNGVSYQLVESGVSPDATGYTVSGLVNGRKYSFKVTSLDDQYESGGAVISGYANSPLGSSSLSLTGGVSNGGVTASASQTVSGIVPDPSPRAGYYNTYGGKAKLVVNDVPASLRIVKNNTGDWSYAASIATHTGLNTLYLEVYDENDVLFATSELWEIFGTGSASQNTLDVTIEDFDLSAFPEVTLELMVTDSLNGDSHAAGLSSANFNIINAGKVMTIDRVVETDDGYFVTFTDITSGKRDIYVHVLVPATGSVSEKSGVSNSHTFGRSYAVIVGINDYPGTVNDLNNCVNDAVDMKNALIANEMWDSRDITMLTDTDATKSNVLGAIEEIAGKMNPYDSFLFFFSGHGSDSGWNQYICTYQYYAWISVSDLADALAAIPSPGNGITNTYVMLDACYSGNFIGIRGLQESGNQIKYMPFSEQRDDEGDDEGLTFERGLEGTLMSDSIFVMTAVSGSKWAWDDNYLKNGVFTYFVVKGLTYSFSNGISMAYANSNSDMWVTAEESAAYLEEEAVYYTETNYSPGFSVPQEPQHYDNDSGTLSRLIDTW